MTGRTHDLAAFTALNAVFVFFPIPHISFSTVIVALGANMIGGLLPDIDDASADIWDKLRGGTIIALIVKPIIGSHRMISHSLIGMGILGYLLSQILHAISGVLLVDMNIIWWACMIGYVSHLVADSLTIEGVPWFLPIRTRIGFPPVRWLRVKTGGIVERVCIFPGLIFANAYLFYAHYVSYVNFFRSLI